MKYLDKLMKGMVYPLVLSLGLSGCATIKTEIDIHKTESLPNKKITLIKQNPKTIDEMISASENIQDTFQYTKRLDEIKQKIEKDPKYNPHQDIKNLAWDIGRSDIDNRLNIMDIVKDFKYYKEERIAESMTYKEVGPENAGGIGLVVAGPYMIGRIAAGDKPEIYDQGMQIILEAAAVSLIVGGTVYFLDKIFRREKRKTYFKRTLVRPYYGTEEVIKTW